MYGTTLQPTGPSSQGHISYIQRLLEWKERWKQPTPMPQKQKLRDGCGSLPQVPQLRMRTTQYIQGDSSSLPGLCSFHYIRLRFPVSGISGFPQKFVALVCLLVCLFFPIMRFYSYQSLKRSWSNTFSSSRFTQWKWMSWVSLMYMICFHVIL